MQRVISFASVRDLAPRIVEPGEEASRTEQTKATPRLQFEQSIWLDELTVRIEPNGIEERELEKYAYISNESGCSRSK